MSVGHIQAWGIKRQRSFALNKPALELLHNSWAEEWGQAIRGEIPLIYLSRHCDENGEPLGYGVVTGTNLLFNKEREEALAKLQKDFRFKDAQQALGKGGQATTDFLNKCIGLGLIRKVGRAYEKLIVGE